jgi:O-acetylhomoserine/O-acetylserine sulfhydrylase-like pyridoxal-dependent enzyme
LSITQSLVTSFKVEILDGIHNFGVGVIRAGTAADTFKIALYTASATLDATTTAYTTSNEVVGTGYVAGGNTLVISQVPTSTGTTAFLDFSDSSWTTSTITARGALIYNSTQSNKAVAVLDFGGDKVTTAQTFTVIFPSSTSSTAIVRIA